jgi:hypothetical protein
MPAAQRTQNVKPMRPVEIQGQKHPSPDDVRHAQPTFKCSRMPGSLLNFALRSLAARGASPGS